MRFNAYRLSFCLAWLVAITAAPSAAYQRPDRPNPPAIGYTDTGIFFVDPEDTPSGQTHLGAGVICHYGTPDDRIQVVGELAGPDSQTWKSNSLKFKQGANLRVSVLHTGFTIFFRVDNVVVPFCKASLAVNDKDKNLSFYDDKDTASFKMECEGDLPAAMGLTEPQKAVFLAKTGGSTEISCKGKVVGGIEAGCFRGDTVVSTERGLTPIRDVAVGDSVWSWDEAAQKKVLSKVTKAFVHPARGLRLVRAGQEVLRTTDEHPFWVEGKGWTRAADLAVGAKLRSQSGEMLAVASNVRSDAATFYSGYTVPAPVVAQQVGVQRLSFGSAPFAGGDVVYNIRVDGTHNYFVGKNEVLVHNK